MIVDDITPHQIFHRWKPWYALTPTSPGRALGSFTNASTQSEGNNNYQPRSGFYRGSLTCFRPSRQHFTKRETGVDVVKLGGLDQRVHHGGCENETGRSTRNCHEVRIGIAEPPPQVGMRPILNPGKHLAVRDKRSVYPPSCRAGYRRSLEDIHPCIRTRRRLG